MSLPAEPNEGYEVQLISPGAKDSSPDPHSHLSLEEREGRAKDFKEQGNSLFLQEKYEDAYQLYSNAIDVSPKDSSQLAIYLANRAACAMRLGNYDQSLSDCSAALARSPGYVKALLRRAKSYEHLKKFTEAKEDYENVLKSEPHNDAARRALAEIPQLMKAHEEQQKAEALAKLKEVGNGFLGLFGMSLDNFKFQQDPSTGSYNISVQPPSK